MDKAKVRFWSRIALYVGVSLLAVSVVLALRVYQGVADPARTTLVSFIAATLGVLVVMPAGFALAMAR